MDEEQFDELTGCFYRVATAITADAMPGPDAQGGVIASLTESVMGVTGALTEISGSVSTEEVADSLHNISSGLTEVANSIHANFTSVNVPDSNLEPANVVDAIDNVARGLFAIAKAIEGGEA